MSNNQEVNMLTMRVGNDNHMIDHGGNHFINGRCVNPIETPQSELDLVYTTVKDKDGETIGYTSNKKESSPIGSTYPKPEDCIVTPQVTGHIPLEQRGTDKNGQPLMYVKRGFEDKLN